MKKVNVTSFVICLALLLTLAPPAFAAQQQTITIDPINVMVGGKVFLPTDVTGKDVPVFVYNGTTYAPLRALAEAYGLNVGYNAEKKLATVDGIPSGDFAGSRGTAPAITKRTTIAISPISIQVNGEVFQPKDVTGKSVPVFVYSGTTYAPLRALAESYGLRVGYDAEKKLATVDFVAADAPLDGVAFSALLKEVNAARKAEIAEPLPFDGYTAYLVDDPATRNLLTDAEISALLSTSERDVKTVSAADAKSDIDLLFRALHATYGAYYYFGEAAWDQAERAVMAWLEGQTTVNVDTLTDVLRRNLSFMVDGHSYVGYDIEELEGVSHEYHYCTAQQFGRDKQGYYKFRGGERVDFVGFSDERVTMSPTLLADGKIVYSPVLHCPYSLVTPTTMQLKNAAGETYTETINWTPSADASGFGRLQYRFFTENGLAYLRIGHHGWSRDEERAVYAAAAVQAKGCRAVIVDLRGNGGSAGNPMDTWIESFTGLHPELRRAHANRYSLLEDYYPAGNEGTYQRIQMNRGKWLPNDIPVIVLVDDCCGSNGESALSMLKTMDNVLVVGMNSSGCTLGGNCVDIKLPHTNIDASLGTMLRFTYEIKNVDAIGFMPDVWCESSMALDAALNLLVNAGIVDEEAARSFGGSLEALRPASLSLDVDGRITVEDGNGFGVGPGTHKVTVALNGSPASDLTVTSADTSVVRVEKTSGSTFDLISVAPGETEIMVQCGNTRQTFGVRSRP